MTDKLTTTQRNVITYLRNFYDSHGFIPSMREIGTHVGLTSTSSVAYQLRQLQAKGHIRLHQGRHRVITLLPPVTPATSSEREEISTTPTPIT